MGKSLDVLAFGAVTIEYISHVEKLPKPGEIVTGSYMETCFGGRAANQCVAAAKLGASTALVAKVGKDKSGDEYLEYLENLSVEVKHIRQVKDCPTGMSEIAASEEGEFYTINVPGANASLSSKDVSNAKNAFKRAKVLLCQLETNMRLTTYALRQFKGFSILHVSPLRPDIPDDLIKLPSILVANELAAAQLADMEKVETLQQARQAAETILSKGAKSVIITMGDQGAVHMTKDKKDKAKNKDKATDKQEDKDKELVCTHVPAADVPNLADRSGAGDAFVGSLAYHITRFPKLPREHHIAAAHSCAAQSMGKLGTQPSFPGKEGAKNDLCMTTPTYNVLRDEDPRDSSDSKPSPPPSPPPPAAVAEERSSADPPPKQPSSARETINEAPEEPEKKAKSKKKFGKSKLEE
ncbi:ribokinase [Drosophila kikkawai]|uniref:Ribokinase n=1 Tax=Drosophila kikkawai TaxID=30033 RepID=A0A6P4IP39_DROKI|nr:ribokinase [Drosophila kikkawai]